MKSTTKKVVKKAITNASGKVAGIYQHDSAMGQLTLALSDEKPKTEQQLKKAAQGADLKQRLFYIGAHGKEKKLWVLTKKDDKVQLKLTAAGKKALASNKKTA
jgi:hypothetical protein